MASAVATTKNSGIVTHLCGPHGFWQITLNINGLFGQHLPKRVDLSLASQEELNTIGFEFNARPQNRGSASAFHCAIEVMYELMARLNATSPSVR